MLLVDFDVVLTSSRSMVSTGEGVLREELTGGVNDVTKAPAVVLELSPAASLECEISVTQRFIKLTPCAAAGSAGTAA